jgi:N-acetylneuraminate lyase
VGVPNLRGFIRLARQAEALGYDGLSVLPPHSYPFSEAEILGYCRELAQATALPGQAVLFRP